MNARDADRWMHSHNSLLFAASCALVMLVSVLPIRSVLNAAFCCCHSEVEVCFCRAQRLVCRYLGACVPITSFRFVSLQLGICGDGFEFGWLSTSRSSVCCGAVEGVKFRGRGGGVVEMEE